MYLYRRNKTLAITTALAVSVRRRLEDHVVSVVDKLGDVDMGSIPECCLLGRVLSGCLQQPNHGATGESRRPQVGVPKIGIELT